MIPAIGINAQSAKAETQAKQSRAAQSEPTDSLTHDLQEVVVEAQNQRTSATVSTYIPVAKIKDAAQDAIDLLQRMTIPEITVDPLSKSVSTPSGQEVSIFINYVPATERDLSGMRMADVRKVEYLDYPLDPRFRGAQHAVNFIMQVYEYGGYTKISDNNFFLSGYTNQGQIYSKFAYRKMTYDLLIASDFVSTKNVGSSETSVFKASGSSLVRDQQFLNANFKYITVPLAFRATYNSDKVQIINSLNYTFHDNYCRTTDGNLTFTPLTNANYQYRYVRPYLNRTLSWSGEYFFALPKKWSFTADPSFTYTNNNTYSSYTTTQPNASAIVNNAHENGYYPHFRTTTVKRFNDKNAAKLLVNYGANINHVNYTGDTEYYTSFSNNAVNGALGYTFNGDKVSVDADAGMCWEFLRTNGLKYDDHYPFAHVSATYSPNDKQRLSFWFQYATNSPEVDERSPNIIQNNEYLYYTGNPMLTNSRHVTVQLSHTFFPNNKFSLNTYALYFGLYDRATSYYDYMTNHVGVLRGYINSGDFTRAEVGINATLRLFNSNFIAQVTPKFCHYGSTGYYDLSRNPLSCSVYAAYYFGNLYVDGFYRTKQHSLSQTFGTYNGTNSYYFLRAGWHHSNWRLSVTAINFARYSYANEWSDITTPVYDSHSVVINSNYHAAVMLSATYTFGYGKQIQRGNEVDRQGSAASAIMQ
jgi:hypothetical protein